MASPCIVFWFLKFLVYTAIESSSVTRLKSCSLSSLESLLFPYKFQNQLSSRPSLICPRWDTIHVPAILNSSSARYVFSLHSFHALSAPLTWNTFPSFACYSNPTHPLSLSSGTNSSTKSFSRGQTVQPISSLWLYILTGLLCSKVFRLKPLYISSSLRDVSNSASFFI